MQPITYLPCPAGLLLFLYLPPSLFSCHRLAVQTRPSAPRSRGERGNGGGLAFALNRVDILSLLWKVERTLETLEGEGRGGGVFILSTLGCATLDRWTGQQEQPPTSHDNSHRRHMTTLFQVRDQRCSTVGSCQRLKADDTTNFDTTRANLI